jgi:hypothetical protein
MLDSQINKYLTRIAIKYRGSLIRKKTIENSLLSEDARYVQWAAYGALVGTPLEIHDKTDSWGFKKNAYEDIPQEYMVNLKSGTFAKLNIPHVDKQTLKGIQERFTYGNSGDSSIPNSEKLIGYNRLVESNYLNAATAYLKSKAITLGIILVLIISGLSFGIHSYLKNQSDSKYWAQYNTPERYAGDGYIETFPCGGVKPISPFVSADISSSQDVCEYFGGAQHTLLDTYSVEVEHFLTDKYNPADEMSCPSPNVYTGNQDTQTYLSESRTIDGIQLVICGKGSSPLYARVLQGNVLYTLSALPHNEKDTYADLNRLIQNFQLTATH